MYRPRKYLALAPREHDCAAALFAILGIVCPYLYGMWRSGGMSFEATTSFPTSLALRLVIPSIIGGLSAYVLWKRRASITVASLGVAIIYTGLILGFFATFVLVTGYTPLKWHSFPVRREESIEPFIFAASATTIGAWVLAIGRRRSRLGPD